MSNVLLAANTVSPRPPLNIFEASRKALGGSDWVQVAAVPRYYIPENGPIPARFVNTVAIMTGLIVTNIHTDAIEVSARVRGADGDYYTLLNRAPVPPNDFLSIGVERQVLMTGETLEVSVPSNGTPDDQAVVHFTYIINQREEFTVI